MKLIDLVEDTIRAGILDGMSYEEIAEMIHILVNDEGLQKIIIQKQRLRLKDFERRKIEEILKEYITEVVS